MAPHNVGNRASYHKILTCSPPWGKCQGISHCLESGHPVNNIWPHITWGTGLHITEYWLVIHQSIFAVNLKLYWYELWTNVMPQWCLLKGMALKITQDRQQYRGSTRHIPLFSDHVSLKPLPVYQFIRPHAVHCTTVPSPLEPVQVCSMIVG